LLISYGGQEPGEFRRHSDDFLAAWRQKGLDGAFLPQPDKHHYNAIYGFTDAASPRCRAMLNHMQLTMTTELRRRILLIERRGLSLAGLESGVCLPFM
jgi:hypothetical protein